MVSLLAFAGNRKLAVWIRDSGGLMCWSGGNHLRSGAVGLNGQDAWLLVFAIDWWSSHRDDRRERGEVGFKSLGSDYFMF